MFNRLNRCIALAVVAIALMTAGITASAFRVESPAIYQNYDVKFTRVDMGIPSVAGRDYRGPLKFVTVEEGCTLARTSVEVNETDLPYRGDVLLTPLGMCSYQAKMAYAEKMGAVGLVVIQVPYQEQKPMGHDASMEPVHIPAVTIENEFFLAFNRTMERGEKVVVSFVFNINNVRYV